MQNAPPSPPAAVLQSGRISPFALAAWARLALAAAASGILWVAVAWALGW